MNKPLSPPQFLTTADSSNLCHRHGLEIGPGRIRQLESEGKLQAIRTAGGHRLFLREDVEAYIKERTSERA